MKMVKVNGRAPLNSYSQVLVLSHPITVREFPGLLKMPKELADAIIVVRNHQKLDFDEFIENEDEIFLFIAVMGG